MTDPAMSHASVLALALLAAACSGNDTPNQPPPPSRRAPVARGPAPIPARPGFAKRRALTAQGKAAAGSGDWDTCARLFEAAHSWADAARCVVHTGDTARALDDLQRSLSRGLRDLEKLRTDPELAPLSREPRWQSMFVDAADRLEAYRTTLNPELEQLVRAPASAGPPAPSADARVFAARRARVAEILATGGAKLADDYLHAAVVYYRADTAADASRARELALLALERDPDSDEARWLAAAADDRRLKHEGKPQKYGTQYVTRGGKRVLWNIDPGISDTERERWSVPSLAEAIAGDAETAAAARVGETL
jgi:hypothetical protein